MWTFYIKANIEHALIAAFIQFMILGTLGEIISMMIRTGSKQYPFSITKTVLKMLGWGMLGLYIKLMFTVAVGGANALAIKGYLPSSIILHPQSFGEKLIASALISIVLNLMLGPSMMILHRLTDNWIDRLLEKKDSGWIGLDKSLLTLIWLWIPLHAFTFSQAVELRIGIAALLSLLLGLVLGWFNRASA